MVSYFLYQAYEIFFQTEKWASSFYSAYGSFELNWNKNVKPTLPKGFDFKVPEQKLIYPWKQKIAIVIGYAYLAGSLLMITGDTAFACILLIPHIV